MQRYSHYNTLPIHELPDATPGYGELLDVLAVEEAVVPLYHERMVQVCLMTPSGWRVDHPLVGDLLHADFAQLAPRYCARRITLKLVYSPCLHPLSISP